MYMYYDSLIDNQTLPSVHPLTQHEVESRNKTRQDIRQCGWAVGWIQNGHMKKNIVSKQFSCSICIFRGLSTCKINLDLI